MRRQPNNPFQVIHQYFTKLFSRRPFNHYPIQSQLTAEEIITRLEYGINSRENIIIQLNQNNISEYVMNYHGVIYQTHTNHLIVKSYDSHHIWQINPQMIRHITLN